MDHKVQSFKIGAREQVLGIFSYLMAFPVFLLVGLNISLYLFPLLIVYYSRKIRPFAVHSKPQFFAYLFGLGAVISVLTIEVQNNDSLPRALAVLPNYLYWAALMVFLINIQRFISLAYISRFIFWGLITSLLYYQVQDFFDFSIFNDFSPNSYAFLLVCYTAPTLVYVAQRHGKVRGLLLFVVLIISLLIIGRRAGFALVLISSLGALYLDSINFRKIAQIGIISLFLMLIMQLTIVKAFVLQASPRMHEFLYENENLARTDESILVRKLQVEKGIDIFSKNPFTGIGLNNFSNYEGAFKGEFEGSKIVLRKKNWNNKSAHNSYISLMAEGGLLLFLPFILMILYNIYGFIKSTNRRTPFETAFYWSFFAMCVHLYYITGIVSVYAWFLVALVSGISVKYVRFKRQPVRPVTRLTPLRSHV